MNDQPRIAIPFTLDNHIAPEIGSIQTLCGATMGTTWSVRFVGSFAAAEAVRCVILVTLERVITQMSAWKPSSNLSRFNRSTDSGWHALPREFATVVDCALRIAKETDGAYDPTVGALVELWGFGSGPAPFGIPPPSDQITLVSADCGWKRLELRDGNKLRRSGQALIDVNGVAKGFAVELVTAALREVGIRHALVEIGGELAGFGVKPDGTPWWVDIDRPRTGLSSDIAPPVLIALHNLAVATSGCERGYESGGSHYSHSINPRTGMPIQNGMVSATVLHPSCMKADAYATALMVMGPDAGINFATEHALAAVILYRTEAAGPITERLTPAMKAMLRG